MAAPTAQINVNPVQEKKILVYALAAHNLLTNQFSLRSALEDIDRNYMREADYTEAQLRAKLANRIGNKTKIQDLTVPIMMPQVRAATAYYMNVFLTGYPIFGVASDPSNEDAAMQVETILAENSITAGWARQLMLFFQDGLKYNLHGVETTWEQKKVGQVITDAASPNGAKATEALWQGNVIRRMDLYNTFFDPRVHPADIHTQGEYAGYIEMYSRTRMKSFINDLFGKVPVSTAIRAFESSPSSVNQGSSMGTPFSYYQPIINPFPIMTRQNQQTFDWMAWAAGDLGTRKGIRYTNVYEVMKLYARIIPDDFGFDIPSKNTPQVFKFTIVNGSVLLMAERQTNAHNFIPIIFGQPLEDGLDYQTKSFATNVRDMQDIGSALWNGFIASKRRLVGDRVLYDPLRVRQKDINNTDPAAKIPVRPSAYGKPVGESVYQFPFRDEQTNSLVQGAEAVVKFADKINGQNPASQGQFVKGNKTRHEYDDVMGHGNAGSQSMALMTEHQVFTTVKQIILLNVLQYQPETTVFNQSKQKNVDIKPVDLRKTAVHFKVSDGMLPTDKEMSTDEYQTTMQAAVQSPTLAKGLDIGAMFVYMMKMRGADLSPFQKSQEQQNFETQVEAWQNAAAQFAKSGMSSEEIAKALGPMPQPSAQLQAEMQQKQQNSGANPSATGKALEATQGNNTTPIPDSAQTTSKKGA